MNNKHFIINKNNHYLIVNGEINLGLLPDCKFYKNSGELYVAAAEATDCCLDEVYETAIILTQTDGHNDKGSIDSWKEFSPEGREVLMDSEYPTIEQYIREWIC